MFNTPIYRAYKSLFMVLLLLGTFTACKKEHLEPDQLDAQPLVWISADMDGTAFNYSAGINSFEASTLLNDSLTYRSFSSVIYSAQSGDSSRIEFRFNNYQNTMGVPASDLDSTIKVGAYNYAYAIPGTVSWLANHLTVLYTTSNGTKYTSYKYTAQAQIGSSFEVESLEKIQKNNLSYLKCKINIRCILYAFSGTDTLHLNNGSGQILLGVN